MPKNDSFYTQKPPMSLGRKLALGCGIVVLAIVGLIVLLAGACMISNGFSP